MERLESKDIKMFVEHLEVPFVLNNVLDWDIIKWDLNKWKETLKEETLTFRMGKTEHTDEPQWENTTEIVTGNFEDFMNFDSENNWLYFDYKHLCSWLLNAPELQKQIDWSKFGFPNKTFKDSTIWIGTKGAHTPCHADTYGCNLVAQIYGRKRWLLFPPYINLQETRIPYEESSIYSRINFYSPNKHHLQNLSKCHTVVLEPGQVLFVPNGWWHYVESLETSISINVWLDSKQDCDKRTDEAITLVLMKAFTSVLNEEEKKQAINLNENIEEFSLHNSLEILNKQINIISSKDDNPTLSYNYYMSPEFLDNDITKFLNFLDILTNSEFDTFMENQMKKPGNNGSIRRTKAVDANMLINVLTDLEVINLVKRKLVDKLNLPF